MTNGIGHQLGHQQQNVSQNDGGSRPLPATMASGGCGGFDPSTDLEGNSITGRVDHCPPASSSPTKHAPLHPTRLREAAAQLARPIEPFEGELKDTFGRTRVRAVEGHLDRCLARYLTSDKLVSKSSVAKLGDACEEIDIPAPRRLIRSRMLPNQGRHQRRPRVLEPETLRQASSGRSATGQAHHRDAAADPQYSIAIGIDQLPGDRAPAGADRQRAQETRLRPLVAPDQSLRSVGGDRPRDRRRGRRSR